MPMPNTQMLGVVFALCLSAQALLVTALSTEKRFRGLNQPVGPMSRKNPKWLAKAPVQPIMDAHDLEARIGRASEISSIADFTEEGYLSVVKLEKNAEMEKYIRRVARSLDLSIRDEGALQGMVPHFSGIKALQTFFQLKQELIALAANPHTWLIELPEKEKLDTTLSLTQLRGETTFDGRTAPLNQKGYKLVAKLKDDNQMSRFIRRTVRNLDLFICDEGRMNGIVPYYSGTLGQQNFAKLRNEIIGGVRAFYRPWVASGEACMLNEAGYKSVAALLDDQEMARFVRRVALHHGCTVIDEDGLLGFVPHFSGTVSVQSLALLEQEVRQVCGLMSEKIHYGSMHDVVGKDGVYQIQLGSSRHKYSAEELRSAGVITTPFAATNAKEAPRKQLAKSCPLMSDKKTNSICRNKEKELGSNFNLGNQTGCRSKVEQAITDSHRRALLAALERNQSDWTAILEDDVVPLHPGYFDASFKEAWSKVPKEAKMVRLSWCSFEQDLGSIRKKTFRNAGNFRLVKYMSWEDTRGTSHYYTGGCTTGYLIHRSFLPEMLGIFPCCCPIDCCLERQLFYTPAKADGAEMLFRGEQILLNMDAWDSRQDSFNYTTFNQGGVLVQDNRDLRSLRPEWKKADF